MLYSCLVIVSTCIFSPHNAGKWIPSVPVLTHWFDSCKVYQGTCNLKWLIELNYTSPVYSKNTTCKALFSSPKAESQIQSPNIVPRDDSSSTGVAFSSSTPGINYSRFLVLEVSRRELVDHQVVARYGRQLPEKVIRLFDGAQSRERFCSLREEWEMTEVEPGDIVHISGSSHKTQCSLNCCFPF